MTPQYAFFFDAAHCSGCKACQAACKDKNNLPVGVLWRRVYEVSGGSWQKAGGAWINTVFAYNLSMSCNHCFHPKCAGVCPVDAYDIHDNGIVVLDSTKCVGCGYCAWACPYGAPQYNPQTGTMTKCDFCLDQLVQGLPPSCVAACPLRVLEYGEAEPEKNIALWDVPADTHPFPLPAFSHTQPRLAVKLHAAMQTSQEKSVANLEEIQPKPPSIWKEVPLMLFTLLGQLAVGGFWVKWVWAKHIMPSLNLIPHLIIGTSMGVGLLASFAHLGTKRNAWRVLGHLSHSWLSREILFAGLFGLGWLVTAYEEVVQHQSIYELTAITSIFGIGLVYSMSQVYRIPAAPGWNTWRTNASFMVSALLLGGSVMAFVIVYEARIFDVQLDPMHWSFITSGILVCSLIQLVLIQKTSSDLYYRNVRNGLLIFVALLAIVSILKTPDFEWLGVAILFFVAAEEGIGRWLFYRSRI